MPWFYFNLTSSPCSGADPEILKRDGALCWPPWLADKENFRFQMVWKDQNNLTNYNFLAKYFHQHFQILSILICHENLSMKSYQFFKICKCFDKEREKHLCSSQWGKKNRKVGLCFITGCFIKSFNMIINYFFVWQTHLQPNFCFLISQIAIFISKIISIV